MNYSFADVNPGDLITLKSLTVDAETYVIEVHEHHVEGDLVPLHVLRNLAGVTFLSSDAWLITSIIPKDKTNA